MPIEEFTGESDPPQRALIEVNTINQFAVHTGQNLENHSKSLAGRGKFVKPGVPVLDFRTKQEVFRFAAHLLTQAIVLPDEEGAHTFDEVMEAVQNS